MHKKKRISVCTNSFLLYPQFDERFLCGDGFMLNLMSVLQKLSEKIDLDKVSMSCQHTVLWPFVISDFVF